LNVGIVVGSLIKFLNSKLYLGKLFSVVLCSA